MCNINIIKNWKGKKSAKITEAMNVVSYHSYVSNDDAEGWFGDNYKVTKSVEKQIMSGKHSFIVSHQRRSTSGKNADMAQPLESENFILTHNGIFTGLGNEKVSDTYEYLQSLEKLYKETDNTITSIKQLNKVTAGYYSVVLHNKKTGETYYYKDTGAQMFFVSTDTWFLASTKKDNVEYLQKYFGLQEAVAAVDATNIYDLNDNFRVVDTFEMYVAPVKQNHYGSGYWMNQNQSSDKKSIRKLFGPYRSNQITTRDQVDRVLSRIGIWPLTIGIHGTTAMVGVFASDGAELVDLFPNAIFKKKKAMPTGEDKLLYSIDLEDIENLDEDTGV